MGYSNCVDIPNYDVVNINLVDDIMTFDIQWEEDFSDEDEPIIPIYVNIFDFLGQKLLSFFIILISSYITIYG